MPSRRDVVRTMSMAIIGAPFINRGRFSLFAGGATEYSARCIRLMRESVVVDMLGIFSLGPDNTKWMRNPDSFTAEDAQRFRDSGISALHPAVGIGGPEAHLRSWQFLSMINGFVASREEFMRIDSADDFARAKSSGRIGVILGVQNSEHFRVAADVELFHALGQRVSQLTCTRNLYGNGSTERRTRG
jgi:membrane dipeptidase